MAAKYAAGDCTGSDQSPDDFEVRGFANTDEQLGLLVRQGMVDLPDVMASLSAQIVADWRTFEPIRAHIMEVSGRAFPVVATDQPGIDRIHWPHFQWLAMQNADWVRRQVALDPARADG